MSKKLSNSMMGLQALSSKEFDDSRNILVERFTGSLGVYKRRLTQSLYWTSLDKDLANQYWRDERWLFGVKICDIVKLIDHGSQEENDKFNKIIGFKK
jgi:hypothetical protein